MTSWGYIPSTAATVISGLAQRAPGTQYDRNPDGSFTNPWVISLGKWEIDCPVCSNEDPCDLTPLLSHYPTSPGFGPENNCVIVTAWTTQMMGLDVDYPECHLKPIADSPIIQEA